MSDLNLHESMIERAARVLDRAYDRTEMTLQQVAREVIEAAFHNVPLSNYSIGTLLQNFDLVIVVKEHQHSAAAGVYRRSARDPEEGFDSLGHYVTVEWGSKPSRYIKAVKLTQLDPPDAEVADAA